MILTFDWVLVEEADGMRVSGALNVICKISVMDNADEIKQESP